MRRSLVILLGLALTVSCVRQPKKTVLEGFAQGSNYAVTYYDEAGRDFRQGIDSIFRAVDLSVNLWVDSSVICKVNRNEEVVLDPIFIDNFNIAQEAAKLSGGYFDPTISPLVKAWGFGAGNGERITENGTAKPSTKRSELKLIDSLRALVDYRKIRIEDGRVIKDNPAMQLDFNAVAQGYTADRIAAYLESQGVQNYLVNNGGEIMAKGGKPDGKPWVVGIEKPAENWDSEQIVQTRVPLSDKGLVTSGSTRKYVERDGKRYSHCIDPTTGWPVDHQVLSVTVLAENATWADALASICMVMGMEKSLPIIEGMDGVEAYYIYVNENNELETFATKGFKLLDE